MDKSIDVDLSSCVGLRKLVVECKFRMMNNIVVGEGIKWISVRNMDNCIDVRGANRNVKGAELMYCKGMVEGRWLEKFVNLESLRIVGVGVGVGLMDLSFLGRRVRRIDLSDCLVDFCDSAMGEMRLVHFGVYRW